MTWNTFGTQPAGNVLASLLDDNFSLLANSTPLPITSVAGTANVITGNTSPVLVLAAYQLYTIVPSSDNTGATTLTLNGGVAKNVHQGGVACVGGELIAGRPYLLYYDGTQFNIFGGGPPFADGSPFIVNDADPTKKIQFALAALTTATVRTITMPDRNITLNNLGALTASLGADVLLNNIANYFDGPSVAQGTSGDWLAVGGINVTDTAGAADIDVKLWDGVTIIDSRRVHVSGASVATAVFLAGKLASPAGNIKISANDGTSTSGKILFNVSGNSMDATLTAIRVG